MDLKKVALFEMVASPDMKLIFQFEPSDANSYIRISDWIEFSAPARDPAQVEADRQRVKLHRLAKMRAEIDKLQAGA
jgi:hypothetical protein